MSISINRTNILDMFNVEKSMREIASKMQYIDMIDKVKNIQDVTKIIFNDDLLALANKEEIEKYCNDCKIYIKNKPHKVKLTDDQIDFICVIIKFYYEISDGVELNLSISSKLEIELLFKNKHNDKLIISLDKDNYMFEGYNFIIGNVFKQDIFGYGGFNNNNCTEDMRNLYLKELIKTIYILNTPCLRNLIE